MVVRRDHAGAVLHLAVRERGAVLDHQHHLALEQLGLVDEQRAVGADDNRLRVARLDVRLDHVDPLLRGALDLVDDHHVGAQQVHLARVIQELVPRPVRVDDHDLEVRLVERQVVVPAVPDDDVGLLLRLGEDRAVVDAGIDDDPLDDVGLVLLALLDGALVPVHVLERREALDLLLHEVAVRHRVPDDRELLAHLEQDVGHPAGGLALPAARADRADRDDREPALDHRPVRADQLEVGPRGEHDARLVHQILVRHVGVREDHQLDALLLDELLELLLVIDRDALGVERAGELGRILASLDVRDLRRRERDHLVVLVLAVDAVEVVEIPAGRPHDENLRPLHTHTSASFIK